MRGLPEAEVVGIERGDEAVVELAAAESIVGIAHIEGGDVVGVANIAAVDVDDEAVVDAVNADVVGVAEAFAEVQLVASVCLQPEGSWLELMHRCVLGRS